MAGDMTVAQYLRRDVAPIGWIIGNLLLWAVIAVIAMGGVTTPSIWFLVGVPAVPVAIGHVCAYVLAQERAPDSIPGAPTN
jgi:uncharacterized membrane protein AbrB (regulator of aidB expression)